MKYVYNKIDSLFVDSAEKNTALNIADALYYGSICSYNNCDCGCTPEQFKKIRNQVIAFMCEEV